ncbi:MAG: tetratricopeptide repeat protein [Cytophagales bacterium]|nr:tetratricopeptide repeat protein [Cytophagales bacterium]
MIENEKVDTTRIKLNIDKINLLARSDLNAAIALGKDQLIVAEKLNFYKGIVKLRSQLSNNYIFTGNYEEAKAHIHFIEKFIKPKDSIFYAGILATYGMMYGVMGKYDSSIFYLTKTIELNERIHNDIELPGNYTNIAIGYMQLANYPMALQYQQKGLALAQKNGNKAQVARTMLNMAITYQNIGDTLKAIDMYENSIQQAKETNSKIVELYGYSNLATLYVGNKEWGKAYELAMKSVDLAATSGDIGIQAAGLAKAGLSLANQRKFTEAAELSKQSITLAESSRQPMNIAQANNAMATVLFLQQKYKEAIPYFEKNLEILQKASVFEQSFEEANKFLSTCYEKTGNYKRALESYRIGVSISDSMRSIQNIRKATEVSMNYEFQKKQEIQEAEQKLQKEIAQSRQLALLAGLGVLLVLAVTAFIGYKNKQKANVLLKEQKDEVENTLGKLKSTQAQLIQSEKMASLGELTAGIAHEIQNPLNFVNNFSEVSNDLIKELKEEKVKVNRDEKLEDELIADISSNLEKINHHGKRADAIVKGMLQHSRTSSGKKEPTDINGLCDEYVRLAYHGLRAKDKSFTSKFETNLDATLPKVNIVAQDMGRVILNLINNAFYTVNEKYKVESQKTESFEPTVIISTKMTDGKIEIRVADNGNGIPDAIKEKIFQPFFTTKPTGQGTGLGLSLAYDIVTKGHSGSIKVETKDGIGTEFYVVLPV